MTVGSAAIGIDIGGGKTLAGRIESDGRVVGPVRVPTPLSDPEALLHVVAGLASALGAGLPIGVGVAGLVTDDGELRFGPNLGIERLHLRRDLEARLSVPVSVHNDAVTALWAEHRVGAAVGVDSVLLLTLGTGVGGAYLDRGRFILGAGFGGEFGHIVVADDGRACGCGSTGCLEAYASGTAIGVRAHELVLGAIVATVLDTRDGFDEIDVTRAAAHGDPFAVGVVREAGRWLGVGLSSLVNAYDPDLVVLGGGVVDAVGPILTPEAASVMASRLVGAGLRRAPAVVQATLGDDAGMVGAGLLALSHASDVAEKPPRAHSVDPPATGSGWQPAQ